MTQPPAEWAPLPLPPEPDPAAAAAPVSVTAEDLAELAELRRERAARLAREAADEAERTARMTPPTHHVHLADGSIVEGSQIATHHTTGDGSGHSRGDHVVAVVGAYPF